MKDRIRSFLVFTSFGYRLATFVILPLLGIWIGHMYCKKYMMPGYLVTAFLLVPIEIMIDHFIFGGICVKDVSHLEYLKCSKRGEWVTRNALLGGMVRVLMTMLMVFVANHISMMILYPDASYGYNVILVPLALLLSSFTVIMLGATIGRFFENVSVYYLIALGGVALETGFLYLIEKHIYMGVIVSVIVSVVVGYFSLEIAMKHIKESYYDKTVKNGD